MSSIEEDIKMLESLDTTGDEEFTQAINNILNDYTRQKQINEEHQKINGELREQVRMLEEDIKEIKESIEEAYRCYEYDLDYSPFSKGIAEMIENILAEREQDKKRIKELEADLYSANEIISDLIDNIPKQVVIDLIENETIDISGFECIAVEDLQELLEGERK